MDVRLSDMTPLRWPSSAKTSSSAPSPSLLRYIRIFPSWHPVTMPPNGSRDGRMVGGREQQDTTQWLCCSGWPSMCIWGTDDIPLLLPLLLPLLPDIAASARAACEGRLHTLRAASCPPDNSVPGSGPALKQRACGRISASKECNRMQNYGHAPRANDTFQDHASPRRGKSKYRFMHTNNTHRPIVRSGLIYQSIHACC